MTIMFYITIGILLASAILSFYLFKIIASKTRIKVIIDSDRIIFKFLFHKIVIPASSEIKFVVNSTRSHVPLGGLIRHSSVPAAEVLSDKKEIVSNMPAFFKKSKLWNPKFRYYTDFSQFIKDVKESDFSPNMDLNELEDILSKPIDRTFIFSKNGIEYVNKVIV